jgi:hypothetical protein
LIQHFQLTSQETPKNVRIEGENNNETKLGLFGQRNLQAHAKKNETRSSCTSNQDSNP